MTITSKEVGMLGATEIEFHFDKVEKSQGRWGQMCENNYSRRGNVFFQWIYSSHRGHGFTSRNDILLRRSE
jgi:hypothetical protein